jgi:hypothetical protein
MLLIFSWYSGHIYWKNLFLLVSWNTGISSCRLIVVWWTWNFRPSFRWLTLNRLLTSLFSWAFFPGVHEVGAPVRLASETPPSFTIRPIVEYIVNQGTFCLRKCLTISDFSICGIIILIILRKCSNSTILTRIFIVLIVNNLL